MDAPSTPQPGAPERRACVFAPSVLLTVTVESGPGDHPELHLHAGGQGHWVAQMLAELGVAVTMVAPMGGETGTVLQAVIAGQDVELHATATAGANGSYVHDRRGGERREVATVPGTPLTRHEVDELYGAALVWGLDAPVCVLTGPGLDPLVPAELYERLASDLRANGCTVVADLSGGELRAALHGGLDLLKVSSEELVRDGWADDDSAGSVLAAMQRLQAAGAAAVVVTRAAQGSLALGDDGPLEVEPMRVRTVEPRGAGDSLTAGISAGLAAGRPLVEALRLGTAAGVLNVTRRGLGTGSRTEIEALAERVRVVPARTGGS